MRDGTRTAIHWRRKVRLPFGIDWVSAGSQWPWVVGVRPCVLPGSFTVLLGPWWFYVGRTLAEHGDGR